MITCRICMDKECTCLCNTCEKARRLVSFRVAYDAHQAADDRLCVALYDKYGVGGFRMRYRPPETPEIAALMKTKDTARAMHEEAWLATLLPYLIPS